jgi:ankyrin repeat protein
VTLLIWWEAADGPACTALQACTGCAFTMPWYAACVLHRPCTASRCLRSRLVRAGANVNAFDYDRRTALHVAAADGSLAAVKILVEKGGARLDLTDRWDTLLACHMHSCCAACTQLCQVSCQGWCSALPKAQQLWLPVCSLDSRSVITFLRPGCCAKARCLALLCFASDGATLLLTRPGATRLSRWWPTWRHAAQQQQQQHR